MRLICKFQFDNATGDFNMSKYLKETEKTLKASLFSPAQQKAVLTAIASCVASNFQVPNEYYAVTPAQQGTKYNKSHDALRIAVCSSKASLQIVIA